MTGTTHRGVASRRAILAGAAGALAVPGLARAQGAWPTARPITMVVAYPPGGQTDFAGRVLLGGLQTQLGQAVVIDNKAGSGGAVGVAAVARSRPDGYVIGLASLSQLASLRYLRKTPLPYDPTRDFEPLAFIGHSAPLWLVAKPSTGFRGVRDLVAYAKANPGRLSYGSDGVGSLTHIPGAHLARQARGQRGDDFGLKLMVERKG